MKSLKILIFIAFFSDGPFAFAAQLQLGTNQLTQGQTGNLAVSLSPISDGVAVAVSIQANAANLELQSAEPAAGYSGFSVNSYSPASGTLNVILYHDPTMAFTGAEQILNIQVKAKENAAIGPQTVTLSQASISDAAGISQPNVQLGNGTVTILSSSQNLDGAVSSGETEQKDVAIGSAPKLKVTYALSGPVQAGCTVTLTVKKPGNVNLGPYTFTASSKTELLDGSSGNWSFFVTGSGTCNNQAYTLVVQQIFPELGIRTSVFTVSIMLLLGFYLLRFRRKRFLSQVSPIGM